MKKLLSILCIVLLIFSFSTQVFAYGEEGYSDEYIVAKKVLSSFGTFSLESQVELYNKSGDIEAVCFNFSPNGYVIVNVNDYSIPEFSPSASTPFPDALDMGAHYVYAGPLNYFIATESNSLMNIKTGNELFVEDLKCSYDVVPDNHAKEMVLDNTSGITPRATLSFITRHLPVTWDSAYYCGLDGCAIELKYLDDYHDDSLLDSTMDTNLTLQKYLLNNKYLPNAATTSSDVVNGNFFGGYSGINKFFKDRGCNFKASKKKYTNSVLVEMQQSFASDYPVIMGTKPADDWDFGDHWVIAYGYYYQDLSGAHIIVNDGFGNNSIYVSIEADHYDDVIFFNN